MVWDYFPDRVPQFQQSYAALGLVLPVLLAALAWKAKAYRKHILEGSVLFLLLLAPVLPLVRHTYFYYLYLPLVPLWFLAGSLIGKMRSPIAVAAVLLLVTGHSYVTGWMHRTSEISEGLLEDPILRYAEVAREGVESFRRSGFSDRGDILFMTPSGGEVIDLMKGSAVSRNETTVRSTFLEQAILEGEALKLFFPGLNSVSFEKEPDVDEGWEAKHIYWTYGRADMKYCGYGVEGRFQVVIRALRSERLDKAKREAELILGVEPYNPTILFILGQIAALRGDTAALEEYTERLEILSKAESQPGPATEALKKLIEISTRPPFRG